MHSDTINLDIICTQKSCVSSWEASAFFYLRLMLGPDSNL